MFKLILKGGPKEVSKVIRKIKKKDNSIKIKSKQKNLVEIESQLWN